MKQYQYRMKCRKATNQNWSSWVDCDKDSARKYLAWSFDVCNQWTYEVRELVLITEISEDSWPFPKSCRPVMATEVERTAIKMYFNHVAMYQNAPSWGGLPPAEQKFWLKEAQVSISYKNSGLNNDKTT